MMRILKSSRTDIVIAFLSGAVVACVAGAIAGHAAGGALGFVVSLLTAVGRQRQRAELQARIDNPAPLQWEVVINNVRVGALSDAHYAVLEKAVFDDWRLHVAQARNLAEVCGRAGGKLLFAVPVAIFWLGVAVAAFDPHGAAAVVDAARATQSAEIIASLVRHVQGMVMVVAFAMCVFALTAARRFGYENQFQAALGAAVRRRVCVAAAGRMILVPVQAFRPA